ncbi:hypothetical protein SASPL_116721 [Salvia splendens]|uniref:Protein kinase domain-containing protein n=1 Tax=Salvia splendens TaxID=180675 RepID=A0A8X8XTQ2_SALSN|nr:hypothetical protein SASPL_116721 [Salvia splendens]
MLSSGRHARLWLHDDHRDDENQPQIQGEERQMEDLGAAFEGASQSVQESYVKMCLETKDFMAKSITLYHNSDCLEFYIHNLLSCLPAAVEAIEMAGHIAGKDHDDMQRKKTVYAFKYHKGLKDPGVFQLMFGQQYLVSQDLCSRMESVWEEDRLFIVKNARECGLASKVCDVLLSDTLLPSAILVNSKDYKIRRRLGTGKQFKEIQWLGESFALRHFHAEGVEALQKEFAADISLSHPNIMHTLCGFCDEDKEFFLVMELMHKDLSTYVKELCGPKKKLPFSIPVAIDLMLQIARGMEYLYARRIPHGELSPSSILIRPRPNGAGEGFVQAKIMGFDLDASIRRLTQSTPADSGELPYIWYAPEEGAPLPPLDFSDVEAAFVAICAASGKMHVVSQIPYQIFAFRVMEREERASANQRETSESGSDGGEEAPALTVDDSWAKLKERRMRSLPSIETETVANKLSPTSKSLDLKPKPGTPRGRVLRPPHTPVGRPARINSESKLVVASPRSRRRPGASSDSELN